MPEAEELALVEVALVPEAVELALVEVVQVVQVALVPEAVELALVEVVQLEPEPERVQPVPQRLRPVVLPWAPSPRQSRLPQLLLPQLVRMKQV